MYYRDGGLSFDAFSGVFGEQDLALAAKGGSAGPGGQGGETRSTIEVSYFRYLFFVKDGGVPCPQSMSILISKKKTFCRLGPWDYSPRCILLFFAASPLSEEEWSSLSEDPQKKIG